MGEADIWRKNVLHPPTVTGIKTPGLPPSAKNHCHHREEKAEGPKAGEGRGGGGFPAAPSAASGSRRGDLPLAGCRTHIVNGAGGRVNGWVGLSGGSCWAVD